VRLSSGPRAAEHHGFDAFEIPSRSATCSANLTLSTSRLYTKVMSYPYSGVDLREHPEAYRIGRGEQGVFHAEPYKGELLPLWTFKTAEAARESSRAIYQRFQEYRSAGDFVGMDVARKFLQMGWTRSRRYAKYAGGSKSRPREGLDAEKQKAAEIFHEKWRAAAEDEEYLRLKEEHRRRNE
jgi:hypothetical protein